MTFKHLQEATQKYTKAERELRELLPLKTIEAKYDDVIRAFAQLITPADMDAIKAELSSSMPKGPEEMLAAFNQMASVLRKYGRTEVLRVGKTIDMSLTVKIPSGLMVNPAWVRARTESHEYHRLVIMTMKNARLLNLWVSVIGRRDKLHNIGTDIQVPGMSASASSIDEALAKAHELYAKLVDVTKAEGILPGSEA